ncbi:MAG: VanZ family protein [Thermoanaerobaculia bacterium]
MKRFLPAVLLVTVVTLTCPFVGLIRDVLFDTFPKGAVRGLTLVLGAMAVALFAVALVRIREHRLPRYGGLLVVGALLWFQAVGFKTALATVNAVEKVHIFEYGLLAYLLYRALRPGKDPAVLILTLLWTAFAGTLEEGMQWLVETRTGEFRDVLLNALSGLCGLVFSLSLEPLEGFSWRLSAARWRLVGSSAAIAVLAMGTFFYVAHLGHLVDDPEIGRFRSHFTREELVETADRRAARWAVDPPRELSPWQREDVFLTEAGWHNQHRNASYELGFYYLARQANLILEKYYRPYLDLEHFRKTGNRRFSPGVVAELDAKAPSREPGGYLSPVAEKRIYTSPSKPVFLLLVLTAAALLWGAPRLLIRRG